MGQIHELNSLSTFGIIQRNPEGTTICLHTGLLPLFIHITSKLVAKITGGKIPEVTSMDLADVLDFKSSIYTKEGVLKPIGQFFNSLLWLVANTIKGLPLFNFENSLKIARWVYPETNVFYTSSDQALSNLQLIKGLKKGDTLFVEWDVNRHEKLGGYIECVNKFSDVMKVSGVSVKFSIDIAHSLKGIMNISSINCEDMDEGKVRAKLLEFIEANKDMIGAVEVSGWNPDPNVSHHDSAHQFITFEQIRFVKTIIETLSNDDLRIKYEPKGMNNFKLI